MNHLKFLFIAIVVAAFASCSQSDVEGGMLANAKRAEFSGAIGETKTRVTGDSWDNGDAIGIYALKAGATLTGEEAIFDGKENIKYTTDKDGNFTAAIEAEAINFPDDKSSIDFIAYYPWQESITNYSYNIDVTSQDFAAIDLLYGMADGKSGNDVNVELGFKHMLSKVILVLEVGDNVTSLEGLTVLMDNVVVDGTLALADGAIAIGENKATITPVIDFDSEEKAVAAIAAMVVPGQNLNGITFKLTLGEGVYEWTPNEQVLSSSKQYVYRFKMHADGVELLVEQPTISSWIEGYKGTDFIDVNTEEIQFAIDGGNLVLDAVSEVVNSVEVTTNKWLEWSATSDADWLTVTPSTGTGTGAIEIAATDNSDEEDREATITIKLNDLDDIEPIMIAVRQKGTNDGTKERPYSIAQAIANQASGGDVWIKGFIVGHRVSAESVIFSNEGHAHNVVLGDSKDEKDGLSVVTIQLNDVKAELNLQDNPEMYRAEVKIRGSLGELYNSPALLSAKEYELITLGDPIFITDVQELEFEATDVLSALIRLSTLQTQEWEAASSVDWLTITPSSGTGSKAIEVVADAYSGDVKRTAKITLTPIGESGFLPIVIDVSQAREGAVVNDGSKERPYTVAEAFAKQDGSKAWVKGYIVGYKKGVGYTVEFSATGGSASNIVIADNKDETDGTKALGVQLTNNKPARSDLNLQDNPEMLGVQVLLYGDLEPYFLPDEGLKNVAEYELVGEGGDEGGGTDPGEGNVATDLFFSEYIEGSSNNKYLEIYNGTGAAVDLSNYRVELYPNGATTAGGTEMLTGTLENGTVLVLKNSQATIYTGAATASSTTNFNGDDAVALIKISTGDYVDIIGRIGERTSWTAGENLQTTDRTLVRKPNIKGGVTVNPSTGFPTLATEWIGYPIDTATYLGSHTTDY